MDYEFKTSGKCIDVTVIEKSCTLASNSSAFLASWELQDDTMLGMIIPGEVTLIAFADFSKAFDTVEYAPCLRNFTTSVSLMMQSIGY